MFADAPEYLAERIPVPYLGVIPYLADLQPESEDSLCREAEERAGGEKMAWIRLPHLSNSQDCQPWLLDGGVRVQWVEQPNELGDAKIVVLPGSKNTVADLEWLRMTEMGEAIQAAAKRGVPVVGICGGYQMLGESVRDPEGIAGDRGVLPGLNMLPVQTTFSQTKSLSQVTVSWGTDRWTAYEIHMGVTTRTLRCDELVLLVNGQGSKPEGCQWNHVWGTYLHGLFESPAVSSELAVMAGLQNYRPAKVSWRDHLQQIYDGMAEAVQRHLNLEEIWHYVAD